MPSAMDDIKIRIDGIIDTIRNERDKLNDGPSFDIATDVNKTKMPKNVKTLKGHFGAVYALHWAGESQEPLICTVSQDSKLIVWNAMTQMKVSAVADANWAMTCAFEQTQCDLVAFGGLDNNCYVYSIKDQIGPTKASVVLRDIHQGYLSCCRFLEQGKTMLTASGDGRCALWDVETGVTKTIFAGHKADCMRVSLNPTNENEFVTGSVDHLCKLWDIRGNKPVITFEGHDSDVNAVEFFPDGQAFASGSDDESCKLFDRRSFQALNTYKADNVVSSCTSVAFSKSGRILFSGFENENCPIAWDVLKESDNMVSRLESKHTRKVSCLGMSAKGNALASGSWDTTIKIWA